MSRFNPHFPHADKVFSAAQQWAERCLLEQQSLLLENQLLWTAEHFAALKTNFIDRPDTSKRDFYEKLTDQLAPCAPLDVALMAEVFWIVELAPNNLLPGTKTARIQTIWNMKPAGPFPGDSAFLNESVLGGLGSAGMGFNQYLPWEMTFAIEAFAEFVAKPREDRESLLSDGLRFADWLDGVSSGKGRQFYHTLCHLLFPDSYERIFSQSHKNKVSRFHNVWKPEMKQSRPALDAALLTLRERLETQYPGKVDYYAPPVGSLMPESNDDVPAPVAPTSAVLGSSVVVGEVVKAEEHEGALPSLRKADNLILYGPPGTGKTFEMERRKQSAFDKGEEFSFVAFHPSYAYEDFMGGLRPVGNENGSGFSVVFRKGPFLLLCEKAHSRPTEQFTLFIDEINRANVAKVFGELITLIEPSKRVVAGSTANDSGMWVSLPYTNELFSVPDNLNIVATMNTADRSIAMMDLALRRRFRFQECTPQPSVIQPEFCGIIHLPLLLQTINDRLEFLLDRDHLIGHSVFMGISSLAELREVIAQKLIPLLQEYFFEDAERMRLALTGTSKDTPFFSARKLMPGRLFPGQREEIAIEPRTSLRVTDSQRWTEADICALYTQSHVGEQSKGGQENFDSPNVPSETATADE